MAQIVAMKQMVLSAALVIGAAHSLAAAPREVRASGWLVFAEAKVRLLVETPQAGESGFAGGVEVRLLPDFKTYWRSPGDSGVPPHFDFSASTGLRDIVVSYPLPTEFDDGAGGMAYGYKASLIFPVAASLAEPAPTFALKLDFAVCGTMCIPLSGEVAFDPLRAEAISPNEAKALRLARSRVPVALDAARSGEVLKALRLPGEKPAFRLEILSSADPAEFRLFVEAKGHFDVGRIERLGARRLGVDLIGHPAPGSNGQFGPVRLTFGQMEAAFEAVIDLDGAPRAP